MTASHYNNQYAVGIAINVYQNEIEKMLLITNELNLYKNYNQIWEQNIVKKRCDNNFDQFLEHWNEDYKWLRWEMSNSKLSLV